VEYRRVEVITGQKRRRDWTAEEKAELLAASMAPGATVMEVARRFGVSRSLLWTWRRKAMEELAAEMGRVLCHCALKARPGARLCL
jgi:transposase